MSEADIDQLIAGLLSGDRRSLARAITLAESTRTDHQRTVAEVLDRISDKTGAAIRIGISGTPGVGKSTFIEALGLHILDRGRRLAVLAIDPSSNAGRGAILGDKTRMAALARSEDVYIRPSPSGLSLGGVAASTADARALVEAAGFDVVLIETVGVGQSEVAVGSLCDIFVLLVAPGGGDELQGIKRGVLEVADLIVVNKADGSRIDEAKQTVAHYRNALAMTRPSGAPTNVVSCSSLDTDSVADVWNDIEQLWTTMQTTGLVEERRRHQAVQSVERRVASRLTRRLDDPRVRAVYAQVEAGTRSELGATDAIVEIVSRPVDDHRT